MFSCGGSVGVSSTMAVHAMLVPLAVHRAIVAPSAVPKMR